MFSRAAALAVSSEQQRELEALVRNGNSGAPAPFVWKASADVILHKLRGCEELTRTGD